MKTEDIIKSKLFFLIENYDFHYFYNEVNGSHYYFKNLYGEIEFYQWEQFGEEAIYVKYDSIFKTINLYEYYPKIYGKFMQEHRGLKALFKNKTNDYWEMISLIFRLEIEKNQNIFGLKI